MGTPKSVRSHRSQVTLAITQGKARSSASALERETTIYFLVFQAIKEEKQDKISRERLEV
jgi:hypothetical protein